MLLRLIAAGCWLGIAVCGATLVMSHSDRARTLYTARLRALADDPLDGTLSRRARQALHALARAWQQAGGSPAAAVDAALHALGGTGLRALGPATGR